MSYLVMECGLSYAVVLDEAGRFLKAANLGYQVGQTLDHVLLLEEKKQPTLRQRMVPLAAAAACLCLMLLVSVEFFFLPVGSVRMQINPEVRMEVNRVNQVIGLEGLNQDGNHLIDGYGYRWKSVEEVSDDLADRAVEMGFLTDGGSIGLTAESDDDDWNANTVHAILAELENHLGSKVELVDGALPEEEDSSQSVIVISPEDYLPSSSSSSESSGDDSSSTSSGGASSSASSGNPGSSGDDDDQGSPSNTGGGSSSASSSTASRPSSSSGSSASSRPSGNTNGDTNYDDNGTTNYGDDDDDDGDDDDDDGDDENEPDEDDDDD